MKSVYKFILSGLFAIGVTLLLLASVIIYVLASNTEQKPPKQEYKGFNNDSNPTWEQYSNDEIVNKTVKFHHYTYERIK